MESRPELKLPPLMTSRGMVIAVILSIAMISSAQTSSPEPGTFFRKYIHLSDAAIESIERGEPVTAELTSKTPDKIYIFGAVYIRARPEEYLKFATDMDRLRNLPRYIGIGRFSDPPKLSDLEGLTMKQDEITSMRSCKPGHCAVQLSADSMQRFQKEINWREPTAPSQATNLARQMILETLQRYIAGGNIAVGTYRDYSNSLPFAEQFQSLLSRQDFLPVYLPELNRFLLDYPNTELPNSESMFYWEKVDFGLKPTLRLNHAVIYRAEGPRGAAQVIAVKQLYASHYFQVALDLSAALTDTSRPEDSGFLLVTLKASRQEGVSGLLGSIRRKIIVSKTRSAQKGDLAAIKRTLETKLREQPAKE